MKGLLFEMDKIQSALRENAGMLDEERPRDSQESRTDKLFRTRVPVKWGEVLPRMRSGC
jgi:hypothetical protein